MRWVVCVWIVSCIFFVGSCGPKKAVTRVGAEDTPDLSGHWNPTDARLVGNTMIESCLASAWLRKFKEAQNHPPVVIVGKVVNKTAERIPVDTFVNDLRKALINSGEVDFVASSQEREEIREERKEQALHAAEETQKAEGQETGADYMVKGVINEIIDEAGKTQLKYFQVELTLIHLENNKIVWTDTQKITKVIDRKKVGW